MIDFLGWIGAICFAICGAPQAFKSYSEGHSNGISWGLISLWLVGEVSMMIYIIPKQDLPLLLNYLGNIIFLGMILFYKIRPRRSDSQS